MRIDSTSAVSSPSIREVAPQRTPASQAELRAALGRAHLRLTGRAASKQLLDTLTAQVSLETGQGGSMYNFNFGGIKGKSPRGETTSAMTREVVDSKDIHLRQQFRSYATIDEGAEDYLSVMQHRFGGALRVAESGDLAGFSHALKQAGYFTAPEAEYTKALIANSGSPNANMHISSANEITRSSPVSFTSEMGLSRVLDALSLSAARIAEGPPDEDG